MWTPIAGPPEDSIWESTGRYNIWDGPVRSGKTVHSLIRWLEFVITAPRGDLWMIGKTLGALERNILAPLREFTGGLFDYSTSAGKAWFAGREIYILGASNKDAEGRIRGSTAAGIYGDEVTLWPAEVFKQCGLRLSVRGAKFFITTNPDGPFHWLKTEYIDKMASLNLRRFTWPISANTTLDPDYIKALEAEYVGLWYKRFILGLWVAAEGAIFDFFDEALHTTLNLPEPDYQYVAIDYGTSNATVFGLFGAKRNPSGIVDASGRYATPQVWLADEYHHSGRDTGRQKTDAEYADDFEAWLAGRKIEYIYLDPSAASFRAELIKRGYRVLDAKNDVINGIRFHAQCLHTGRYKVARHCRNVIREYSAYLWDPKAQARGEDKPLKIHDHGMDMSRYGLYSEFGIEKVKLNLTGMQVIGGTQTSLWK